VQVDHAPRSDLRSCRQHQRRRSVDHTQVADRRIRPQAQTLQPDDQRQRLDDRATLTFPMNYRSKRFEDEGVKQLQLVRDQGQWRIAREQFTAD